MFFKTRILCSDMGVTLFSFGYKHGPPEADTVIDVRFLPNPFYVPALSSGTGLDENVASYVLDNPVGNAFIISFEPFLISYIQGHVQAEHLDPKVAIGCTGGKHRSVAVAEATRDFLEKNGISVELFHRDIEQE